MRRVLPSVMAALGVLGIGVTFAGAAASAAVAPSPSADARPGEKICTIEDERLIELSGLVATDDGFVVINDGSEIESRERIFFLDKDCKVTNAVRYSGGGPLDPEDLALAPDGKTLYIADIGDNPTNQQRRETVALWTMPLDGSAQPVIHRLTYPDGPHDAEALLFKSDGTPIIVTKEPGKSALYAPTGPLVPDTREGVPMEKLGEVRIPNTNTSHEALGAVARKLVTGGATAPDGSRVVLRTYTDAFEWDVPNGDVVAALTSGTPRVTALPGEPWGEAISYTPDGTRFVTVSETESRKDLKPTILSYTPSKSPAKPADDAAGGKAAGPSLLDRLGIQGLTYLVAAVGAFGAVLVAVGVVGILRARRGPNGNGRSKTGRSAVPEPEQNSGGGAERGPNGGGHAGRGGRPPDPPPAGSVYGGSVRRGSGSVYGGGSRSGGVYGGRHSEGSVYGAPQSGRSPRVYGSGHDEGWSRGHGAGRSGGNQGYGAGRSGGKQDEGYRDGGYRYR